MDENTKKRIIEFDNIQKEFEIQKEYLIILKVVKEQINEYINNIEEKQQILKNYNCYYIDEKIEERLKNSKMLLEKFYIK